MHDLMESDLATDLSRPGEAMPSRWRGEGGGSVIAQREFDYGGYEPAIADELRDAATRIRNHHRAAKAEIGRALLRVKEKLGHGHWGAWLAAEFEMSVSTAERYMGVAGLDDKIVTVPNLPAKTLYLLAAKSIPRKVVDGIVADLETGKPLANEAITARVRAAKDEAKQAAELAKLSARQRTNQARRTAEAERRAENRKREAAERQAAATTAAAAAVAIFVDALGDRLGEAVELAGKAGVWPVWEALQQAVQARVEAVAVAAPLADGGNGGIVDKAKGEGGVEPVLPVMDEAGRVAAPAAVG
jgi:hypothetical protein